MLTGTENNLALPAFVLLDQVSPDDTMARNIMQTIAESKAAENARKRTPSIGHKFSTVLGISKKSNANSAAGICSFSCFIWFCKLVDNFVAACDCVVAIVISSAIHRQKFCSGRHPIRILLVN